MMEIGNYTIGERIAAAVYRGTDKDSGQPVVLKHNNPGRFMDGKIKYSEALFLSTALIRYEHDMLNLARHPGVCDVYGHISDGEDHWLAMQDLGADLTCISDVIQAGGALLRAGNTLVDLHGRGIVHRDVRPKNISAEGVVFDFDSAHEPGLRESYGWERIKKGTSGYMPPEFETEETIYCPSIDVFSFAKTADEILGQQIADFNEVNRVVKAGQIVAPSDRPLMREMASAFKSAFSSN